MIKFTSLELLSLIIAVVGATLIMACEHEAKTIPEEKKEPKEEAVKFSNVSPNDGASFAYGESVPLYSEMESDKTMHGYEVYVVNETNKDTLFQTAEHIHGTELLIDEEWVNEVEEDATMKAIFLIRVTHEGESVSKQVRFSCAAE